MSDIVLHVGGLRTYFRTPHGIAKAVDGVSFSIRQGETFAIVGESGCGKSVTALSIMGLVPHPAGFHAGGSVHIGETEMTALSESKKRKLRGREVAMVFQDPMTSLNAVYTVGFQIVEAIRRHGRASEADRLAAEMLDRVGIPDPSACLRSYPHQLSGGMKQRVMIAMALSCRPRLLIADEPTTALDVTVQAQILDLIRDLQRDIGMSVLLITHDLGVVRENSDRIAVMYAGQIVENASTAGLFASPRHPYTEALFRSLPSRQQRGGDLETIEGMVPLATLYPTGCRFADRCDDALPVCRETPPERFSFEAGHDALCHLYAPGAPREDHVGVPAKPMSVRPATAPAVPVQPSGGNALVEVRDLRTHFPIRKGVLRRTVGYVRAVDGVSFSIPRGRTLAVVGESGCGKTTLGKSLLRLAEPTSGQVLFGGAEITGLSRSDLSRRRSGFQMVFQDPYSSLDPRMMVRETIEEGMVAQGYGKLPASERDDRIRHVLQLVGLDASMLERYPHEFSGGQRQRIGIARALAVEPRFIVCDEPTSSLDVSVQAQILNLLKDLQSQLGLSYLFITHNLSVVEYLADEVAVMYLGRFVERGTTEEVFDDPKHPYTKALLSAVPKIDDRGVARIRLEGDVPSPARPPAGCHFHPRCGDAFEPCSGVYPPEATFGGSHACRCFLYIEPPPRDEETP